MKKIILYTIAHIRRVDFYKTAFFIFLALLASIGFTVESVLLLIAWVLEDIAFEIKKLNRKK